MSYSTVGAVCGIISVLFWCTCDIPVGELIAMTVKKRHRSIGW